MLLPAYCKFFTSHKRFCVSITVSTHNVFFLQEKDLTIEKRKEIEKHWIPLIKEEDRLQSLQVS